MGSIQQKNENGISQEEELDMAFPATNLEKRQLFDSSINAKIKSVSHELRRFASLPLRKGQSTLLERSFSGVKQALKGLRFMRRAIDNVDPNTFLKKFDELCVDGVLKNVDFGTYIGMESKKFTRDLFNVLSCRRHITVP